jgi:hypothetical protein
MGLGALIAYLGFMQRWRSIFGLCYGGYIWIEAEIKGAPIRRGHIAVRFESSLTLSGLYVAGRIPELRRTSRVMMPLRSFGGVYCMNVALD